MIKKKLRSIVSFVLCLSIISANLVVSRPVNAAVSTSGIKGVNNAHIWFDSQAYTALDTIKSYGFNTVRVVWATSGSGSRLGQIISRCKALGLKPIPELHDVTGGTSETNGDSIDKMVNYWISVKSYIPSDVWVNIANEWGPSNSTVWRDAYINGIKKMRNAGMSNTVVVDSGGWGQDDKDILNYGPAILSSDSNVVFSVHMYGSWNDNNKIDTFLSSCQSKGLPIMVGEFGYNYNNGSNNLGCKVDAAHLISTCNSKGIGYLAWSWYGNNAENAWLDLTNSDWKTLNTWGNLFKNLAKLSDPLNTPTPTKPSTPTPTIVADSNHLAMPLISRQVPAFASSDVASNANDANYGTSWRGNVSGWLAYDLSKVSSDLRSKILVAWYNTDSYDYDPTIKSTTSYNKPQNYTIEGNTASGGGNAPTSGWVTLASVSNNNYHSRQHLLDFSGYNWIRMNITKGSGSSVSINMDVHSAKSGTQDDWVFYGDSITAGGTALNGNGKGTIAQIVNASVPNYFPVTECGGTGSISSADGARMINSWLSVFPGKYVAIALGTNDSWGNPGGTTNYYNNMETMIKAVIAAGKIPIVSKIPWARLAAVQNNVPAYNAKVEALYKAYPQIIKGPDFWTFFQSNQSLINGGTDNVHPTTEGYNAMREQWAKVMISEVYNKIPTQVTSTPTPTKIPTPSNGDAEKIEAESGVLIGTVVENSTAGYSGTGYVSSFDTSGDALEITMNKIAGDYDLTIGYAGVYGDKTNDIYLNGSLISSLVFPQTTGFSEISVGKVHLNQGENTIKIDNNWGWFFVDYIKIAPATAPTIKYGDVNGDGSVDAGDYLLLRSYLLKKIQKLSNIKAADTNIDGTIDTADYTILRKFLLKNISELPYKN